MAIELFPKAFRFLSRQQNLAADRALAEALPDLTGSVQEAAFAMLLRRGHAPSLAKIVQAAVGGDSGLRSLVLDHLPALSSVVSVVLRSSPFARREAGIAMLAESGRLEASTILAETLRVRCQRTRSLAALALRELAEVWLTRQRDPSAQPNTQQTKLLAAALGKAVAFWERHQKIGTLEAVSWLGWRLVDAVAQKLDQPRTRLAAPLQDLIRRARNPQQAEFLVCVLGLPSLRGAAADAMSRASTEAMQRSILSAMWLLADRDVAAGCRWVKQCPWLISRPGKVLAMGPMLVEAALRFVGASGLPNTDKTDFFTGCMQEGQLAVQRAAFWQLCQNQSETATNALRLLVQRNQQPFVFSARSELYRRGAEAMPPVRCHVEEESAARESSGGDHSQEWLASDVSHPEALDKLRACYDRDPQLLLRSLRSKLASSVVSDRLHGLKVIGQLNVERELAESMYRLASDPDKHVRSVVMSMLVGLPGPTTLRLLRSAVYDPDARVQANAIESMDRLAFTGRTNATRPLLSSPNSRVRANAVKSLLKLEISDAGEALLEMLEDDSRSQRLSALWVVERLKLRSLLNRLIEMSELDADTKVRRRAARVLSGMESRPEASDRPVAASTSCSPLQPEGGSL